MTDSDIPAAVDPLFSTPLRTLDDAMAWIRAMHARDLLFHFDDRSENIVDFTGERIFTDAQATAVDARIDEVMAMDWASTPYECPFGFALHVQGHVWEK